MATRRCLQSLTRHHASILSSHQSLKPLNPNHLFQQTLTLPPFLSHQISTPISFHISSTFIPICHTPFRATRFFCSNQGNDSHDEDEATEVQEEGSSDDEGVSSSNPNKSLEEKEIEAAEIGYKVVGPLQRSDKVFKPYEPVFAIIQIGSHQFKVSNGDSIFLERLKYCEVNDKLILNKVLMLGSSTQTIIGRPILPDSAVHAVVEEHALDAKVIIFKKKRRKNYRRTKGHRQELTKLRITDIQGIPKPENTASKGKEADAKKEEKVAVLA